MMAISTLRMGGGQATDEAKLGLLSETRPAMRVSPKTTTTKSVIIPPRLILPPDRCFSQHPLLIHAHMFLSLEHPRNLSHPVLEGTDRPPETSSAKPCKSYVTGHHHHHHQTNPIRSSLFRAYSYYGRLPLFARIPMFWCTVFVSLSHLVRLLASRSSAWPPAADASLVRSTRLHLLRKSSSLTCFHSRRASRIRLWEIDWYCHMDASSYLIIGPLLIPTAPVKKQTKKRAKV